MRATKVNAGLAESNGKLMLGIWRDSLHVTYGLTACTPGSAPGPTLGNGYGKTLPFAYTEASISLPNTQFSSHKSSRSAAGAGVNGAALYKFDGLQILPGTPNNGHLSSSDCD